MDSHTIENFGNKGISAIGAVLAGQNRGPYTRNRVYIFLRIHEASSKVVEMSSVPSFFLLQMIFNAKWIMNNKLKEIEKKMLLYSIQLNKFYYQHECVAMIRINL